MYTLRFLVVVLATAPAPPAAFLPDKYFGQDYDVHNIIDVAIKFDTDGNNQLSIEAK